MLDNKPWFIKRIKHVLRKASFTGSACV